MTWHGMQSSNTIKLKKRNASGYYGQRAKNNKSQRGIFSWQQVFESAGPFSIYRCIKMPKKEVDRRGGEGSREQIIGLHHIWQGTGEKAV
ncbi:hypothetical protein ROHU_027938 [Labeo rohita]|uniref:Uncharacterized protein n=1 Tax=Labeo rohita TaxID=84645 RepID=A0A498M8V0_LABRO|nr:hypothetical protein ROHU_027938 [Labeo rohita]